MPQESERPRPHGDPLQNDAEEPNAAQRGSDATPDAAVTGGIEEPGAGVRSTANGIPAADEDDGERRKNLYEDGAEIVSRID
jgi:hypothetical protein